MSAPIKLSGAGRDAYYMSQAFKLAEKGRYTTQPNPNVGCVFVKGGEIVAQAYTLAAGGLHAEARAIKNANSDLSGATVYITLEPCCHYGRTPPCSEAIIASKPKRVVIAALDPNPLVAGGGIKALELAGIETTVGVGALQSAATNRAFFHRMRTAKPYVTLKVAMSLDGKTAMANGMSQWISSAASRDDVHKLRLAACAIVTGVDTVLADDPQMTARLANAARQPHRVVLDSRSRLPLAARILQQQGHTWVFQAKPNKALQAHNVTVFAAQLHAGRIDLTALLTQLAQHEINHVLVEAGATLSGAFIKLGLVDEMVIYMAPDLMGSAARGAFAIDGLHQLAQRIPFTIKDTRLIGRDIKLTLRK